MTTYCYDTEFLEDGRTIDLISIGIVSDDEREYYAVNADCDFDRICQDDWLWLNVVQHLPTSKKDWTVPNFGRSATWLDKKAACVKPKWVIANEVREFIVGKVRPCGKAPSGEDAYWHEDLPELWAYFAAYDHVALCQLFGKMIDLPDLMPMWTHDLMQLIESIPRGRDFKKPEQDGVAHNALEDARWNYKLLWAARQALRGDEEEPPF